MGISNWSRRKVATIAAAASVALGGIVFGLAPGGSVSANNGGGEVCYEQVTEYQFERPHMVTENYYEKFTHERSRNDVNDPWSDWSGWTNWPGTTPGEGWYAEGTQPDPLEGDHDGNANDDQTKNDRDFQYQITNTRQVQDGVETSDWGTTPPAGDGWVQIGERVVNGAEIPCPVQHVPVTICHATGAEGHWTRPTVDDDSILNDQHEELGNGHAVHQGGRDIIPPFTTSDGFNYPGHNWDAAGQAVYNNGCELPPVQNPCDWPQVKGNDCGDHQVVVECSSISGTTSFAVTNKPWSYAVWFSESAPAGPAAGTPNGLNFAEDYNGGSVTVYAWVAGTENDALAGSGLPTFNAPETYAVDTDCETPAVTVAEPDYVPPTCSSIGSVTTTDTEDYTWDYTEDGAGNATVEAIPAEGVTLTGQTSWTYPIAQLTGDQCAEPEPTASYNGTVDCAGLTDGSGTVDRDGLEGDLTVTVNGQPAVVDGDNFSFTDAAQPLSVVVKIGETDVPVEGALVGPPPGSCEEPPTDVCPNIDGAQSSVPDGMVKDGSGNCVTPPEPPVDVCPNISGDQASVPSGMVKDGAGNCVTPPQPPTDVCPNIDGAQSSVPDGMVKDGSGNCVKPTPQPNPNPTPTLPPTPVGETS